MQLKPISPKHHSGSDFHVCQEDEARWLVKRYLKLNSGERCERECSYLRHWKERGFAVPAVCRIRTVDFSEPYLVMEFIGEPLSQNY